MGFILEKEPTGSEVSAARCRVQSTWFVVSTGGYKRRVLAKDRDRAVVVFFLKEQPQTVGFAICIRQIKGVGKDDVRYAYTPGVLAKHFPALLCEPGRTKNSFRVVDPKNS